MSTSDETPLDDRRRALIERLPSNVGAAALGLLWAIQQQCAKRQTQEIHRAEIDRLAKQLRLTTARHLDIQIALVGCGILLPAPPYHLRLNVDLGIRPPPQRSTAPHLVYFIQAGGEGGLIKIGHTTNAGYRVVSLQTGSALPLRLLVTTPGDHELEGELHARFSHLRSHGEWFHPGPELLALIASLSKGAP